MEPPPNPSYLQEPITAPVEGGDDGGVDVAAVEALEGSAWFELGEKPPQKKKPPQILRGGLRNEDGAPPEPETPPPPKVPT